MFNLRRPLQHYKYYTRKQSGLACSPTMNGVGESRTSARISGHRGMYGHCQRNGNIIYVQITQNTLRTDTKPSFKLIPWSANGLPKVSNKMPEDCWCAIFTGCNQTCSIKVSIHQCRVYDVSSKLMGSWQIKLKNKRRKI